MTYSRKSKIEDYSLLSSQKIGAVVQITWSRELDRAHKRTCNGHCNHHGFPWIEQEVRIESWKGEGGHSNVLRIIPERLNKIKQTSNGSEK